MPSPIKASNITELGLVGDVCSRFIELLRTRVNFKAFLGWALDASGEVSDDFVASAADRGAVPVGSILIWPASLMPSDNWLVCNGQAVSRATYSALFDRIGLTYGSGDGSTTFNLPDAQERFVRGVGPTVQMASRGGKRSVTLAVTNLPKHSHTLSKLGKVPPDSNSGVNVNGNIPDGDDGTDPEPLSGISTDESGAGESFDITPENIALYYIIKAK